MTEDLTPYDDVVPIWECADDEEAEVIISYLAAHGIEAMINSNMDHAVLPVAEDTQILVYADDADEARQLLDERASGLIPDDDETIE